jgi:hypothetical protein
MRSLDEIRGHTVLARDLMNSVVYERDGEELVSRGMFLDLPLGLSRLPTGDALEDQRCEIVEPLVRK